MSAAKSRALASERLPTAATAASEDAISDAESHQMGVRRRRRGGGRRHGDGEPRRDGGPKVFDAWPRRSGWGLSDREERREEGPDEAAEDFLGVRLLVEKLERRRAKDSAAGRAPDEDVFGWDWEPTDSDSDEDDERFSQDSVRRRVDECVCVCGASYKF